MQNRGKIYQIMGAVVDVKFTDHMPPIYQKLVCKEPYAVFEVLAHLEKSIVRCMAITATEGLARGMDVFDSGSQISIPVGEEVLGRVLNVLGEPLDKKPKVEAKQEWNIHRQAPTFFEQSAMTEVFETGIKVIDLIAPYSKGGKIGLKTLKKT